MPKVITAEPPFNTLTVEFLDNAPQWRFAKGTFIDSPEGINVTNTWHEVRWIATRGFNSDWTIYNQNPHYIDTKDPIAEELGIQWERPRERILTRGDKFPKSQAKRLVPCTPEAFERYRT